MQFLVGKNRRQAVQIAKTELLWEQVGEFKLLDLYREEVTVICHAAEMRGHNVTCVYLAPGFDELQHSQWEEFQHAFATRKIRTARI